MRVIAVKPEPKQNTLAFYLHIWYTFNGLIDFIDTALTSVVQAEVEIYKNIM